MGLIGSIFGGGTGAYKKGVRDLKSARDKELAHWEKLAYGDPLQNSENQAALRQARELLKGNINRAAGAAAPCRCHLPLYRRGRQRQNHHP